MNVTEDSGLMGYNKQPSGRKPSDGQPFAKYLSSVAGNEPGVAANSSQPMFMRKKMRKKMRK